MAKVTLGHWVIELDQEATNRRFRDFEVSNPDDQIYRNFQRFCKGMTEVEKEVFPSLGIVPEKCNVETLGFSRRRRTCPTNGHYILEGKYISKPEEITWSVEDLVEHEFIDDRPAGPIIAGRIWFNFEDPESKFGRPPKDLPAGCICLSFSVEDMPWLLDEKPEPIAFEIPRWWEIHLRISEAIERRRSKRMYDRIDVSRTEGVLRDAGVSFHRLSNAKILRFKKDWLAAFGPDADPKWVRDSYLPYNGFLREKKYSRFMWHLFSFGLVQHEKGEVAEASYRTLDRGKAILYLSIEELGYELEDASGLSLDRVNGFIDVVIADRNLSWTYAHTHEWDCGPYFCARDVNTQTKEHG
jgi:hypothetical protein